MASFNVPLRVDQGTDYTKRTTWKTGATPTPVDLTGCTAEAHLRPTINSTTKLLTLSTADGSILLGGIAGTVEIVFTPEMTEGVTWRNAVYDLEVTFPAGTKRRLMHGPVTLSPEVTRDDI